MDRKNYYDNDRARSNAGRVYGDEYYDDERDRCSSSKSRSKMSSKSELEMSLIAKNKQLQSIISRQQEESEKQLFEYDSLRNLLDVLQEELKSEKNVHASNDIEFMATRERLEQATKDASEYKLRYEKLKIEYSDLKQKSVSSEQANEELSKKIEDIQQQQARMGLNALKMASDNNEGCIFKDFQNGLHETEECKTFSPLAWKYRKWNEMLRQRNPIIWKLNRRRRLFTYYRSLKKYLHYIEE